MSLSQISDDLLYFTSHNGHVTAEEDGGSIPEYSGGMHEVPIEDTIDLHSFQPREVRLVVEEYLYQAIQRGFTEVRIIHGRGVGVQREMVRSILSKHPGVVRYADLPDRGSTVAVLRASHGRPEAAD